MPLPLFNKGDNAVPNNDLLFPNYLIELPFQLQFWKLLPLLRKFMPPSWDFTYKIMTFQNSETKFCEISVIAILVREVIEICPINQNILIDKLPFNNISSATCKLFKSYLSNLKQVVKLENQTSMLEDVMLRDTVVLLGPNAPQRRWGKARHSPQRVRKTLG